MANGQENLRPFQSVEEAREKGRKGGIKSGITRRKKKTIAQAMELLLRQSVTDPKQLEAIEKSGLAPAGKPNMQDLLLVSVFMRSVKSGTIDDLLKYQKLLGEGPLENDNDALKAAREILSGIDSVID